MSEEPNIAEFLSGLDKRIEETRNFHKSIIEQATHSLRTNPNLCSPFRIHLTPIQLGLMRESMFAYNRPATHIIIGAEVWPRLVNMAEAGTHIEFDALDHECITGKVGSLAGIPIISGEFFYREPWYNLDKRMVAFVNVDRVGNVCHIVAAFI